jgi:hypothetical protein
MHAHVRARLAWSQLRCCPDCTGYHATATSTKAPPAAHASSHHCHPILPPHRQRPSRARWHVPRAQGEGPAAALPPDTAPTALVATRFDEDGMLRTKAVTLPEPGAGPAAPRPGRFWAAGFSFARGAWVREAPYPSDLPWLFFGEEQLMLARMWRSGWCVLACALLLLGAPHVHVSMRAPCPAARPEHACTLLPANLYAQGCVQPHGERRLSLVEPLAPAHVPVGALRFDLRAPAMVEEMCGRATQARIQSFELTRPWPGSAGVRTRQAAGSPVPPTRPPHPSPNSRGDPSAARRRWQ